MIVVSKANLRFLLAGRAIEVDVPREYRRGRSYALGTRHNRTVCRVQILACRQLADGWRVTVRQMSGDEVRLLARSGSRGYVTAPVEADPADPDVLRGAASEEPEALSEEQVRHLARYRAARDRMVRSAPIMDLRDRMLAELDDAMRSTPSRDDKAKLRAARHHLSRLGKAS